MDIHTGIQLSSANSSTPSTTTAAQVQALSCVPALQDRGRTIALQPSGACYVKCAATAVAATAANGERIGDTPYQLFDVTRFPDGWFISILAASSTTVTCELLGVQ